MQVLSQSDVDDSKANVSRSKNSLNGLPNTRNVDTLTQCSQLFRSSNFYREILCSGNTVFYTGDRNLNLIRAPSGFTQPLQEDLQIFLRKRLEGFDYRTRDCSEKYPSCSFLCERIPKRDEWLGHVRLSVLPGLSVCLSARVEQFLYYRTSTRYKYIIF